jgi:Na+-transporting NADH:ubiquinone oxidoreductase subunit E
MEVVLFDSPQYFYPRGFRRKYGAQFFPRDVYFSGYLEKIDVAFRLGVTVTALLAIATPINNLIYNYLLKENALIEEGST